MSKFFGHFPTIDYPELGFIKDFTPSVRLRGVEQTVPYQQPAGTRPDTIASKYYGDPVYEWLLYMANDVDNPRDLIYLTEDQFTDMISRQYGSIEKAEKLTKHWRHNWRDDLGSNLTQLEYDLLAADVRPLFDAVRDFRGDISGYKRKREDVIKNTNLVYQITVDDASSFVVGAVVEFKDGPVVNGRGEVTAISDNSVFVHHIVDSPTGANLDDAVVETITLTATNLSATLAPYYERVSLLKWHEEVNDLRRELKVVDKRLAANLERRLREVLE